MEMNLFSISAELPSVGETTVIEASAGTGKTWMISSLAVRYVACGEVTIDQLLIVTFTRLATSELKSRIRDRFVEARDFLTAVQKKENSGLGEADGDIDALFAVLLEDAQTCDPAEMLDRITTAIGRFELATIATIHGFSQSVLTGLGITGQVVPIEQLITDTSALRDEVTHDVYLRLFAGNLTPPMTFASAAKIAKQVVEEPATTLLEPDADDGGEQEANQLAYQFAHEVREEFFSRLRDRNFTTYADFLRLLQEAIGAGDTAAAQQLRARWPVVLVDEFQDTDPTQWQIFRNTFHEKSALILIGDPKQAIYRFRGGDVDTYTQATRDAHSRFTLATNYRSTPTLITSFNQIFTDATFGQEITASAVKPGPAHKPELIVREDEGGKAPFAVRFLADVDASGKPLKTDESRRAVVQDLCAQVVELLDGYQWLPKPDDEESGRRAVGPGDIAVLCNTNEQCDEVAHELRRLGVPVSHTSGKLAQTAAADDLRILLEAMARPARIELLHRVAVGPYFEFELADTLTEETSEAVATRLLVWQEVLHRQGLAGLLDAAVGSGFPRRIITSREGKRYLADLQQISQLSLADPALELTDGPARYIRWLTETLPTLDASRMPDTDGGAIRVLTVHKAKGLQFPIVLLPYASFGGKPAQVPHLYTDADGVRNIAAFPNAEAKRQTEEQELEEALRVFYVAATRAISHVIAWWAPASIDRKPRPAIHRLLAERNPGDGAPNGKVKRSERNAILAQLKYWANSGNFSSGIAPITLEQFSLERPKVQPLVSAEARAEEPSARKFTRILDRTWRRTSYSALAEEAEYRIGTALHSVDTELGAEAESDPELTIVVAAEQTIGSDVPSPMAQLPKGNRFGSLVHDVLEFVDPASATLAEDVAALINQGLTRWPVAMTNEQREQLTEAIVAVCTTPLGPPFAGETLADLGTENRLPELSFDIPMAGGRWSGPHYGAPATLRHIARLLRRHLPEGDPLLPYAAVLDHPAYDASILHGYLTGSIDAVLRGKQGYVVVDYKTNWLAGSDEELTLAHYGPAQLQQAMAGSSYPLQALLYAVAAHRFLRWRIPDYDPERDLGGVAYLYVRGMAGSATPSTDGHVHGVFSWRPPAALVAELSDLLDAKPSRASQISSPQVAPQEGVR